MRQNPSGKKILFFLLCGISCTMLGGMSTLFLMQKDDLVSQKDIAELRDMKSLIHKYGLYEINEDDMQEGMLKGAIEGYSETDPYAVYYPAKHNASIDDNADIHAESYKGIGAMVNVNDEGSLTVQQVFEDSGASDAGLKEGDKITSINGTTVTEDNADELLQNIKEDENETVSAEVQDGEQQKEVLITKKDVTSPKVTYQITETEDALDIRNGIGYISISDFAGNAATQFKDTIDRMAENHELKGVILDLRNNGGGEIDNACEILDYILKDDITTYSKNIKKKENEGHTFLTRVESKHEEDKEWVCKDGHFISEDIPITVIVNEYL